MGWTLTAAQLGPLSQALCVNRDIKLDTIHPIIERPHTYELVGFYWHMNQNDFSSTYIDLQFSKDGITKKLRFEQPVQVKIDVGFYGNICGLEILDIRSQQLDRINIEVRNFEQDAGITFKANRVFEIE